MNLNRNLKKTVRTMLPRKAIRALSNWAEARELRGIEAETFDPTNLRPAAEIALEEVLSDPQIADQWSQAKPRINALIPETAGPGG